MKKQFPLWSFILAGAICVILAVTLTTQLCYRLMFLDTKNEYERQLSELSEKLAPPEDKTAFRDLPDKLGKIYTELLDDLVDKPEAQDLEDQTLHKFLESIGDPYARYLTKSEYAEYYYAQRSTSVGVGVMIVQNDEGKAIISHVEKNGPAGKAGIVRGDEIVAVDGKALSEVGYDEGISLIRGKEKTDVTLTVKRASGAENNIIITRQVVKFSGVRSETIDGVGLIRLMTVGSDTVEEFKTAVDDLVKSGVRGLVFDLRSTSGGTLSAIHKLIDYLLPDKLGDGGDRYAFKTVDAHENVTLYALDDGHSVDLPFAVLIDRNSEKAGEIFARSMRLLGGAKVYGETSPGNGTVQTLLTLKDGSAVIFTSGRILFSDDSRLDGGVVPDREIDCSGINVYLISPADDPAFTAAASELK